MDIKITYAELNDSPEKVKESLSLKVAGSHTLDDKKKAIYTHLSPNDVFVYARAITSHLKIKK